MNIKEQVLVKGEVLLNEFARINPCKKLPAIVDGEFVLWESRAILRYLCNKYAPDSPLYPTDLQQRAKVDQFLDFDASLFYCIHDIVDNVLKGEEIREEQTVALDRTLNLMNGLVADRKFVVGECLTIADISMAHTFTMLGIQDFKETEDYHNLMAGYKALKEESSILKESLEKLQEKLKIATNI